MRFRRLARLVAVLGLCCAGALPGRAAETSIAEAPEQLSLGAPDTGFRPDVMTAAPGVSRRVELRRTFFDDFDSLEPGQGRWAHRAYRPYPPEDPENSIHLRLLNDQQAFYADPAFEGTTGAPLGLDPFSVENSILTITADRVPAGITPGMIGDTGDGRALDYYSGQLSSWPSFTQKHGFFEVRAKIPRFEGAWPALWLVGLNYKPEDGPVVRWPEVGEIDFLEMVRGDIHQAVHYGTGDGTTHASAGMGGFRFDGFDEGFHNYGVLWTEEQVTFFIDRKPTTTVSLPGELDQPMQMILNLGIGGRWPGSVDPAALPVRMEVDWAAAYEIASDEAEGAAALPELFLGGDFSGPVHGRMELFNDARFRREEGRALVSNGSRARGIAAFPVQLPAGEWRVDVRLRQGQDPGHVAVTDADGAVLIDGAEGEDLLGTITTDGPGEIRVVVVTGGRGQGREVRIERISITPAEPG
ncbi:glycoside hydrolase family 16 protein (plasmid) [Salipiger sp. H15]|uniref:Glycoside hydrolase family 16 protein n=1 Tax=Alloyangia sp. H15 TaxID=3029062 RepID=A0AAU8AP37_9RHOB